METRFPQSSPALISDARSLSRARQRCACLPFSRTFYALGGSGEGDQQRRRPLANARLARSVSSRMVSRPGARQISSSAA